MSTIAKQLLSDARRGIIDKDALLEACVMRLESISQEDLYRLALDEGFVGMQQDTTEEVLEEQEMKNLDATQRIIEKVLSRHGE